jgi:predicted transcriptional regulator
MLQVLLYSHMSSRRLRSQAEITRTRIESIIRSQPGVRFRELVHMTKLAHGALRHSIKIFEAQRRIRVISDRGSMRFFPKNYDDKFCSAISCVGHSTTTAIMNSLLLVNECNFSQIKKAVMRSSSTVYEHLKRLCLADLVLKRMAKKQGAGLCYNGYGDGDNKIINKIGASNNW